MQKKSRSKLRRNEVLTGLTIILVGFSFLIAMLLDFNIGNPYSTLLEDLAYLSDHSLNQKISSWAWLTTSVVTLVAIPFYLVVFHKKLKILHFVNGLLMLGAAGGAMMMGLVGLELNQILTQDLVEGFEQTNEQFRIGILEHFKDEKFYTSIGGSCAALFAFTLSMTRFRVPRFPMISTILLMISGPALIYLNWYNPEHILRTVAIAGMMIGLIVFCVRLINRGMIDEKTEGVTDDKPADEAVNPP
jgi:cation transport ATPase